VTTEFSIDDHDGRIRVVIINNNNY